MKTALAILATIGALLAFPDVVRAQSSVGWTVGAATDYRSRGFSKSLDKGYAYASSEWRSGDNPIYIAAQAATVDLVNGASYEIEARVGARPRLAGFAFDFTALYRVFPDASPGTQDDFVEYRAQASRAVGPVTIRGLIWYTPDMVGVAKAARWSDLRATLRVMPRVRISASVGRADQDLAPDYVAWNAGAAFDLTRKAELDLRWYDTNSHQISPRYGGEAVAALVYKF